ncbi:MAG: TetR/AcrR family transcriptional regulator [Rhodocyclaceae bacterium]|nr:TetR/AcrR family transcriptional regulator [Rhodocyclaceae bacterium]
METITKIKSPTKRAPQQQRALDRIEGILVATEAVITESGYDGLTMVSIAERAGITHTSIYHYFSSIEAILSALIARHFDEFDRNVATFVATADTPAALVDAAMKSLELGFEIYRGSPVARGLTLATRYLPVLRAIDDEDTIRNAKLIADRFVALEPSLDRNAIYITTVLIGSLAVRAYETALSLSRPMQRPAIDGFLIMARHRLTEVTSL